MLSNLPPGVTPSMIPGCRPEDELWDNWWENQEKEICDIIIENLPPGVVFDEKADPYDKYYLKYENVRKAVDRAFEEILRC